MASRSTWRRSCSYDPKPLNPEEPTGHVLRALVLTIPCGHQGGLLLPNRTTKDPGPSRWLICLDPATVPDFRKRCSPECLVEQPRRGVHAPRKDPAGQWECARELSNL